MKSILMLLIAASLLICGCDNLLDAVQPEMSVDDFLNKVVDKTWIVDSIRVTKYSPIDKTVVSDTNLPTGTMLFQNPEAKDRSTLLGPNRAFLIHTFMVDAQSKTDTVAWTYDLNSDVRVAYVQFLYAAKDGDYYGSGGKVIYNITECSKSKFRFYRYEALMDAKTGQHQGFLESVYVMHR